VYCTRCSAANPPEARYCAFCGAKILVPDQAQPSPGPTTSAPTPPTSTPSYQPGEVASASPPAAQNVAPAAPYPSYPSEPAAWRPADPLAVASLVLAIVGPFTLGIGSLLGLVLGIVSLRRIGAQQPALGGRGLALSGVIVSGATLGLALLGTAVGVPLGIRNARQRNCLSNVKQLGTGILMYCGDYDERLPLAYNWCDALDPYVLDRQTYVCPSVGGDQSCYTLSDPVAGSHEAQWQYPAETEMLFESEPGWNQVGPLDAAYPRHSGGAHVCYVDGHAKWCKLPLGEAPILEEGTDEGTMPGGWPGEPPEEGTWPQEEPAAEEAPAAGAPGEEPAPGTGPGGGPYPPPPSPPGD
jgi:prepilin-type processing-associated H-X9-DG protein